MLRHLIGLALIVAGGGLLGLLLYPSFAHSLATGPWLTMSMPGALLLGMLALIAICCGGLLASPGRPSKPEQPGSGHATTRLPRRG